MTMEMDGASTVARLHLRHAQEIIPDPVQVLGQQATMRMERKSQSHGKLSVLRPQLHQSLIQALVELSLSNDFDDVIVIEFVFSPYDPTGSTIHGSDETISKI